MAGAVQHLGQDYAQATLLLIKAGMGKAEVSLMRRQAVARLDRTEMEVQEETKFPEAMALGDQGAMAVVVMGLMAA